MRSSWLFLIALAGAMPAAAAPPQLKYVVILSRHGVRSPTWDSARLNQYSAEPWPDWGVPPGNLTVHGRALMKIMGGYYRDFLAAFPRDCAGASHAYFWADQAQRTVETAHALAEGMFPGCEAQVHSVGEGKRDALFDPIEAGIAKPDASLSLASVAGRIGPNPEAVIGAHRAAFDALAGILNGKGEAAMSLFDAPMSLTAAASGANMNGPLNTASTLTEDFLLEYTDGMPMAKLGWGRLTEANLEQILALHTAYADLMRRTPYLARARGSNLLNHVLRSLDQAMTGKPVNGAIGQPGGNVLVISGHDTNLSNLSGMLDLSWVLPSYQKDDTPPGSALVFSLWLAPDTGRYSVRVQFLAQTLDQMRSATELSKSNPPPVANVFVPGCSGAEDGYACDWAAFVKAATDAIDPSFVEK
jgi:4-phytase/acid phosphatase